MSHFAGYEGAGFNWSTTGPCPPHLRTFDEKGNRIATLEPIEGVPGGVIAVPYYGKGYAFLKQWSTVWPIDFVL